MSEDEACRRIDVARLGRKFPAIFALLASGALSLSVAALLKDCITDQNHMDLLVAVSGKSVRAAREELAARFPVPDVPSSIRKLPQRPAAASVAGRDLAPNDNQTDLHQRGSARFTRDIAGGFGNSADSRRGAEVCGAKVCLEPEGPSGREVLGASGEWSTASRAKGQSVEGSHDDRSTGKAVKPGDGSGRSGESEIKASLSFGELNAAVDGRAPRPQASPLAGKPRSERARVEPIAAGRYRVQFTASLAQKQKLEEVLDLMAHRNPSRDLAIVVERGVELLIEQLLQQRMGQMRRVSPGPRTAKKSESVRVGRSTRRAVVERDGLRCSFVSDEGQRCEARAFLEFDHRRPFGKGGDSRPSNVRILCRTHNRFCAELEYGRAKIEREIDRKAEQRQFVEG